MKQHIKLLSTISVIALLTACGGGGGTSVDEAPKENAGGTDGGTQQEARYQTLLSDANKTSTLGGSSMVFARDAGIFATKSVTGTLTHDTGAIKADDGIYLFQSASQSNDGVYFYDGNGAQLEIGNPNGTYEYMGQFYQEYTVDGTAYSNNIVAGIITTIEDIPTSGMATYSGEAHINGQRDVTDSNTKFDMLNGSSTVSVDFGAAHPSVDVEMTKFTDNEGTSPFTTVKITGMTLNGNTYSGGTIKTYNSGTEVNMTGQNVTGGAQGAFFGYDEANSRPDETGGVVIQVGETGGFGGTFLAD